MTKTIYFILLNLVLSINLLIGQQVDKQTVYFDYDKYDVTDTAKELIQQTLASINIDDIIKLTLVGHTDSDGSIQYNQKLSENRSAAVFNFLVSMGIPTDKIKIESYGESNPIAQNDTEQGKQKNRRVEILIEKMRMDVSDIFTKFSQETQVFKFHANQDITIKGKEGTQIHIPKNSLCKQNGEIIKGEVVIELKEFYKKSDIILSNLHTMSNNKILETAGMIFISAQYSDEKLKLKQGREIEIEFVSENKIEGMETFIGEQQENQINWVQQNTSINNVPSFSGVNIFASDGDESIDGEIDSTSGEVYYEKLNEVDKLIINSGKLGWINCDRFYSFNNKTNLTIEMDVNYDPKVRLVFKNINSIMKPSMSLDNKINFNDIPVGQKATLIALSYVNDEPFFTRKDIVITKNQNEKLELSTITLVDLEKELQKLD